MNNTARIPAVLALRDEGRYYASAEERQRYWAIEWGCDVNKETGIALLSVKGSMSESYLWSGSYPLLRARIESLLEQDNVKTIAIEINSPGGDVSGLFECCDYIKSVREKKPIYAHVTGMCCSAAYAIAGSCLGISATHTSQIGSVGIYGEAWDDSEWQKKNGILSKIFRSSNAQKKNQSLFTEEGEKDVQAKLDYYEDCFYSLLSESRGMSKEECIEKFGHGAVFLASEALDRKMIDTISSYEDWINTLASSTEKEAEGANMDLTAMSAEERTSAFQALVQAEPSLLAEVEERARTAERERITALYAERNEGNAGIIDKAVGDGSSLSAIAMDLYKAEKDNAAKMADESAKLALIRAQAENEQNLKGLQNPMPDDLAAFNAVVAKANETDDKEGK